jgi:hypothetical protein
VALLGAGEKILCDMRRQSESGARGRRLRHFTREGDDIIFMKGGGGAGRGSE